MVKFTSLIALYFVALALLFSTASAGDSDDIVESPCTINSSCSCKLKLKARDGGIEWEFEVDQNINNRKWLYTVKKKGVTTPLKKGSQVTKSPSGSFDVSGYTSNSAGTDTFIATASDTASGESCKVINSF